MTWWQKSWLVALFLCYQLLAGSGRWRAAETAHLQKAFLHRLRELGRRGLPTAVEARDAEKDALGLGVVAGAIPVGYHRPIAAKHLHGGGHLGERTGQQSWLQNVTIACWREGHLAPGPPWTICFSDSFPSSI